jgi:hypothetical protein
VGDDSTYSYKDNKGLEEETGDSESPQFAKEKAVKLTPGMVYTYMTNGRGVSAADYILSCTSNARFFLEDANPRMQTDMVLTQRNRLPLPGIDAGYIRS